MGNQFEIVKTSWSGRKHSLYQSDAGRHISVIDQALKWQYISGVYCRP